MKPCAHENCTKLRRGTTLYCVNHGGGKRCTVCNRAARGALSLCCLHGGGKRCKAEHCTNGARVGMYCKKHGGDKCLKHNPWRRHQVCQLSRILCAIKRPRVLGVPGGHGAGQAVRVRGAASALNLLLFAALFLPGHGAAVRPQYETRRFLVPITRLLD